MNTTMALYLVILFTLYQIATIIAQPMVQVEQGLIVGETVHFGNGFLNIQKDIDVYLGIPYAEPPIEDNRFRATLPKQPWNEGEIYNATYYRDICHQKSDPATDMFTKSEDCLHLNVYVPHQKVNNTPVMVFIHGGGFRSGEGYSYNGIPLSSVGDIIMVTINYRLSAFGFLSTGDDALPGNFGMLDQVEALRWLKTNIHAFGGDPGMVTIFGESAGGASVSALLLSPLSRDLFQQGILESGSILAPFSFSADENQNREDAFKIGDAVGCQTTSTEELISCMREKDAEVIITAALEHSIMCRRYFPRRATHELNRNNNFKKCPLINGFNKDEGTLDIAFGTEFGSEYINSSTPPYVSKDTFNKEITRFLTVYKIQYTNDVIEDSIRQEYVDWPMSDDPEADYFDALNYLIRDNIFACLAIQETRAHVMHGEYDSYQYYFTHAPSKSYFGGKDNFWRWLGAAHAEELAFVFGFPFILPEFMVPHEYSVEEISLSRNMMEYWTNFAKKGDPNKEHKDAVPYEDEKAWPAFTVPNLDYKDIAVNLTSGRGVRADECQFWNEYLKQLTTFTADLEEAERQWRDEFYSWKHQDMPEWREAFDEYQAVITKH